MEIHTIYFPKQKRKNEFVSAILSQQTMFFVGSWNGAFSFIVASIKAFNRQRKNGEQRTGLAIVLYSIEIVIVIQILHNVQPLSRKIEFFRRRPFEEVIKIL